jgi:hypothetical protein
MTLQRSWWGLRQAILDSTELWVVVYVDKNSEPCQKLEPFVRQLSRDLRGQWVFLTGVGFSGSLVLPSLLCSFWRPCRDL